MARSPIAQQYQAENEDTETDVGGDDGDGEVGRGDMAIHNGIEVGLNLNLAKLPNQPKPLIIPTGD